jgi:hypothetical protein
VLKEIYEVGAKIIKPRENGFKKAGILVFRVWWTRDTGPQKGERQNKKSWFMV